MKIKFQKFHGASNDFVIIDGHFLEKITSAAIKRICDRKRGVGADGLIFVSKPKGKNVIFKFFNSDGNEADFCGNGLRCATMFCKLNYGISDVLFKTNSGICSTKFVSRKKILVEVPVNIKAQKIRFSGKTLFFCDTGVPHTVIIVKNLKDIDVEKKGKIIRWHDFFSPAGTNVDFVEIISENKIFLRTYERGVEGETDACGSGACASALSLAIFANLQFPIDVITKSSDTLRIYLPEGKNKDNTDKLFLEGTAEFSFRGEVEI